MPLLKPPAFSGGTCWPALPVWGSHLGCCLRVRVRLRQLLWAAVLRRTSSLPGNAALAIRLHHDYQVFLDPTVPQDVMRLISLNIVAEEAIQRYSQMHDNMEWHKGGDYVASTLKFSF